MISLNSPVDHFAEVVVEAVESAPVIGNVALCTDSMIVFVLWVGQV